MRTATRSVALLALAAVLGGCGSGTASSSPTAGPTATPVVTAPPTVAPTPTPEPTPDIAAIGAAYLAFAESFNAAQAEATAAVDAATNDAEAVVAYQLYVDAFEDGVSAISAIEFPPELAADVADLTQGYTLIANAFRQLVIDPQDPDPFIDQNIEDGSAMIATAAAAIRAGLGLPPPPTIAP